MFAVLVVTAGMASANGLSGTGDLTDADAASGTVSIRGYRYQVTERTQLQNDQGLSMSLAQLAQHVSASRDAGTSLMRLTSVRYEAVERSGERVLLSLRIVETPR